MIAITVPRIGTSEADEFLAMAARGARRPQAQAIADSLRRIADYIEANIVTSDEIVAAGYMARHCELQLQPAAFRRLTEGQAVRQEDCFWEADVEGVLVVTVIGEPE